jgi:hypothetical protein
VRNKITGTSLVFYALGEKWPADNASAASGGGGAPFHAVVLKTLVAADEIDIIMLNQSQWMPLNDF